jgi:hypothetical protein
MASPPASCIHRVPLTSRNRHERAELARVDKCDD